MSEQILTQEEVDSLLRGISGGEIETETDVEEDESGIVSYDLTSQDRIIRGRMPTLEIINERFARFLRNVFTSNLRRLVDVTSLSIDMVKYGEFLKMLPVPTSIHLFHMEPLRGIALFVLDAPLIFSMIDIFFGGNGSSHYKVEGRDFSPIEMKLIMRVVDTVFQEIEKAWMPVYPIKTKFVRSEINPQFVMIMPMTDVVIISKFSVEMEFTSGNMMLCFPYTMIQPIKEKLTASFQSEQMEQDSGWIREFRKAMLQAEVDLTVQLGKTDIKAKNLIELKTGDVIRLDRYASEPVDVLVEGVKKFRGMPGVYKGNKAVRIVSKVYESF